MPIKTANHSMKDANTNEQARGFAAKLRAQALTLSLALTAVFTATSVPTIASADSGAAWVLDKPLVPYSATYSVGNDVIEAGQAKVELTQNADEWNYSLTTRPTGLFRLAGKGHVSEISTFKVINENNASIIRPQRYKFRQDNRKKRAIDATFNWDQRQLYFQHGANSTQSALNPSTLDRMTMTITMMSKLTPGFESFTIDVFDGGRIKQVLLSNEGTEILETSLGSMETVRVKMRNVETSRRETITWFAPSLNNLPVRIEQRKKGKLVARLKVRKYDKR